LGVKVSEGIMETVSVGMGVKISVAEIPVDVSAGMGEAEAGACPVLLKLQAAMDRVKIIGKISFMFFMM
jgi:hypothetical protein